MGHVSSLKKEKTKANPDENLLFRICLSYTLKTKDRLGGRRALTLFIEVSDDGDMVCCLNPTTNSSMFER